MTDNSNNQQLAITDDFAKALAAGIAESRASTVLAGGGFDILRMLKSGEWVFGQSSEPVQEGSRWVANVMALQHGWVCWVEGEGSGANRLAGEVLAPMAAPKPAKPGPIDGFPFVELRVIQLACLDGDDAGTNVSYRVQSLGGMKAVDALLQEIQRQLLVDKMHSCPILRLGVSYYEHKKWGRVYTPVLERVGWADINGHPAGDAAPAVAAPAAPSPAPVRTRKAPLTAGVSPPARAPEPKPEPEPEPKPAPTRARKAPLAAAAPVTPAPEPAPVQPTAAARAGQRRRPAAS